eukprot:6205985-Pleurochrysis_carterae.AAC.1
MSVSLSSSRVSPGLAEFQCFCNVQAVAVPTVLGMVLLCILRIWILSLCQSRRAFRQASIDDAPELEEIIDAHGRIGKRIDSVKLSQGRLVSAHDSVSKPQRHVPKPPAKRAVTTRGKQGSNQKRRSSAPEREPVLKR